MNFPIQAEIYFLLGLRKEVGPPLRELGQSFASFVKNTIGSKDSPLSAGEISNEKREDEIQPLPGIYRLYKRSCYRSCYC